MECYLCHFNFIEIIHVLLFTKIYGHVRLACSFYIFYTAHAYSIGNKKLFTNKVVEKF